MYCFLQNNDIDPIWNDHFKLEVEDLASQKLTIKVFDDEGLQEPQLIGTAHLELNGLVPERLDDMWLPLYKESKKETLPRSKRGEVCPCFLEGC
jgi:Ca2+-dependent lipid-binding protein